MRHLSERWQAALLLSMFFAFFLISAFMEWKTRQGIVATHIVPGSTTFSGQKKVWVFNDGSVRVQDLFNPIILY